MNPFIELFSVRWIEALGWTLIHSLWQGALIAIVIAIIMIFLQKSSARFRYLIYSIALLLIFASSLVTFIKQYNISNQGNLITSTSERSEVNPAIAIFTEAVLQSSTKGEVQKIWLTFQNYFNRNMPLLVALWFIGLVIFMLRLFGGMAYTQRLKYYKVGEISDHWKQKFNKLSTQVGIKKSVRFIESAVVKVPVVVNIIKPIVIIPIGMLSQMPPDQIEAIVAHELAHIYRKDYLFNLLQSFIEVIFFYHPAVWWLSNNIRSERENICDDIAVIYCKNSLSYARALAAIQELQVQSEILAPAFSSKRNLLLNRIQRMMKKPRLIPNYAEGFITALIVFISIAAISATAAISFKSDGIPEFLNALNHDNNVIKEQIEEETNNVNDLSDDQIETISDNLNKENEVLESIALDNNNFHFFEPDTIVEKNDSLEKIKAQEIEKIKEQIKESHIKREAIEKELQKAMQVQFEAQQELREVLRENQKELSKEIAVSHFYNVKKMDSNLKNFKYDYNFKYKDAQEQYNKAMKNYDHKYSEDYFLKCKDNNVFFLKMDSLGDVDVDFDFEFHPDFEDVEIMLQELPEIDDLDEQLIIIERDRNELFELEHRDRDMLRRINEREMRKGELKHTREAYRNADENMQWVSYGRLLNTYKFDSKIDRIVRKELESDDLIKPFQGDYVIELDKKNMYINGEKQSRSAYKKYRQIIDSMIDEPIKDDFNYKLVL